MKKLNPKNVGLSLGITFVMLSIICLILILLFSVQSMMTLVNYFTHGMDVTMTVKQVTFLGSIIGIVELYVIGFLVGYLYALVYNWISKRSKD